MKIKLLLAACAAMSLSAPASAATLFSQPASTGIQASPGSLTYTFSSAGGAGNTTFNLEGYLTLDGLGASGFDDTFTLTLNSVAVVIGQYLMGGGGSNNTVLAPGGATITSVNNGFGAGGNTFMSIPLLLASGVNTISFSYGGIAQGTGDEGWGLNSVLISGNAAQTGVPEPATWALLILGFGAVGQVMRRGAYRRPRIRFT